MESNDVLLEPVSSKEDVKSTSFFSSEDSQHNNMLLRKFDLLLEEKLEEQKREILGIYEKKVSELQLEIAALKKAFILQTKRREDRSLLNGSDHSATSFSSNQQVRMNGSNNNNNPLTQQLVHVEKYSTQPIGESARLGLEVRNLKNLIENFISRGVDSVTQQQTQQQQQQQMNSNRIIKTQPPKDYNNCNNYTDNKQLVHKINTVGKDKLAHECKLHSCSNNNEEDEVITDSSNSTHSVEEEDIFNASKLLFNIGNIKPFEPSPNQLVNTPNPQLQQQFHSQRHQPLCNEFVTSSFHKLDKNLLDSERIAAATTILPPLIKTIHKPHPRKGRRRRGNLPEAATNLLKCWLFAHMNHPYPTEEEKFGLSAKTQLTLTQINNWFTNARRRILKRNGTNSKVPVNNNNNNLGNNFQDEFSLHKKRGV